MRFSSPARKSQWPAVSSPAVSSVRGPSVGFCGQNAHRPTSRNSDGLKVSEAINTTANANGMATPASRNLPNCAKIIMPMPQITVAALAVRAWPTLSVALQIAVEGTPPWSSSSL